MFDKCVEIFKKGEDTFGWLMYSNIIKARYDQKFCKI